MSSKKRASSFGIGSNSPKGILELERFTDENLNQWNYASQNLNELEDVLYFSLEPERRKLRPELIKSIQSIRALEFDIKNWSRVVNYEHSANPLSCLGSVKSYGGRFNVGREIDSGTLSPWPALYIADCFETAFREKRQVSSNTIATGLSPSELALQPGENLTSVSVQGKLYQVFDIREAKALEPICKILKKIKMPERAKVLQKRLKITSRDLFMISSAKQLYSLISQSNWRILPTQFGLPAQSQIIAELIKAAGFEAILYQSSRSSGDCLAIFPELLADHSYIEINGKTLDSIKHKRLDSSSAQELMCQDHH